MKKIMPLLLVFTLLFSLTAQASAVTVQMGEVSCKAGESVAIPLTLTNNTGFVNLSIEIGYDASALKLKSVVGAAVGATFTKAQSITANPYNMAWDSTENITFNGTLATIEFEVLPEAKAGTYPVTVSYYKGRNGDYSDGRDVNYDTNFLPLNIGYVNGQLEVTTLQTPTNDYTIDTLTAATEPGVALDTVPESGEFYAEAVVTKNSARDATDYLIVALYNDKGVLCDMAYMRGNFQEGQTVTFGTKLHGTAGATMKAFVWDGFSTMQPLSASVSF